MGVAPVDVMDRERVVECEPRVRGQVVRWRRCRRPRAARDERRVRGRLADGDLVVDRNVRVDELVVLELGYFELVDAVGAVASGFRDRGHSFGTRARVVRARLAHAVGAYLARFADRAPGADAPAAVRVRLVTVRLQVGAL